MLRVTRRTALNWLALPAAGLWGQGMSSRGVKALARGKPAGLPFSGTLADIAAQAGVAGDCIDGDVWFTDVTKRARLTKSTPRVGAGCAFVDYDRDGRLDLFVSNYLVFDPKSVPRAGESGSCDYKGVPVACGPKGLPYGRHSLY